MEQLRLDAALVYALLANHNSAGGDSVQAAYLTALEASGLFSRSCPLPEMASLDQVDEALVRLSTLDVLGRQAFVAGAAAVLLSVPPLLPIEA